MQSLKKCLASKQLAGIIGENSSSAGSPTRTHSHLGSFFTNFSSTAANLTSPHNKSTGGQVRSFATHDSCENTIYHHLILNCYIAVPQPV
jgi:hypothetical protein